MRFVYRSAVPSDAGACISIRGRTRENAVSATRLASLGITTDSWARSIETGELPGVVCESEQGMVGYCFGNRDSGEVVVLALLPEAEGQGVGRKLLQQVVSKLQQLGHGRLFLGCSADPAVRSYGFYRHLGWRSTHALDGHGDEILELQLRSGSDG